jgi:glutamine synthetase
LKSTLPIVEANKYGWCESQALAAGTEVSNIVEEMAFAMEQSDIEIELFHSEGAPGQYEFVVTHLPPMEAIDALISTRETIYNIAAKHGLRATLAPRLHMNSSEFSQHQIDLSN